LILEADDRLRDQLTPLSTRSGCGLALSAAFTPSAHKRSRIICTIAITTVTWATIGTPGNT
jgi:hypothetical protein